MYRLVGIIAAVSALSISADVVYFRGDTSLECDVVKVTENDVTVKVAKGLFTFPRDRVKNIEYNYRKKKEMLGQEDYEGHYKLGLWCINCGEEDNALAQFLYVEGRPGIPDEIYVRIAQIYQKKSDREKALEYYKKYLAVHPGDELIIKKIETLSEDTNGKSPVTEPDTTTKADEGLEILSDWRIEKWGNPAKLTLKKTIEHNEENKILKVEYSAKNSDKTAVRLQFRKMTDITGRKHCSMDVFNPEKRVLSVAIAFVTAPGYIWYESKSRVINQGWNLNVAFDLEANEYKAKETGWRFTSPVKNRDKVIQFIILLYNGARKGTLFMDNIKFK